MNHFEQRQADRQSRLEARAAKAVRQANAAQKTAHEMAEVIPFGQPILVGHHSEGRDRRYRSRIHNTFSRAFALLDQAERLRRRAQSVGTGGISSDDPDAIDKLKTKLLKLEQSQRTMKAANAFIRKNDRVGLAGLGFSPDDIEKLFKPDYGNHKGFASYSLSNNNANITSTKKRIAELETLKNRKEVEIIGQGFVYREDAEDNRCMFIFEDKPEANIRDILKRAAFKWSPTRGAWVRKMTANAIAAARYARADLEKLCATVA